MENNKSKCHKNYRGTFSKTIRLVVCPRLCTLNFCSGNLCFMPERSRETTPAQFGLAMLVPIMSCFFCSVQFGTGEMAPPGAITLTPATVESAQCIFQSNVT